MTSNERSNRRRFLEGAVCAGLQLPSRRIAKMEWDYNRLYIDLHSTSPWLCYYDLHRLVETLDRLGFQLENGQVQIYNDGSFSVNFFDPFDEMPKR